MTPHRRIGAVVVAVVLSAHVPGCASTVKGTAVLAQDASPQRQSPLEGRDLDDILLTPDELDQLLGSVAIEINNEFDKATDDSSDVSNPNCLGTIYTAEEPVYAGTGYLLHRRGTGVRRHRLSGGAHPTGQ